MKSAESKKKTARRAGVYYLLHAITGGFGTLFLPEKIMVPGDAAATIDNLLANEFLFRLAIFGNFTAVVLFIFLVLQLYRLFRDVNEHQAKLMAAFVIVTVPAIYLLETFDFTALMLATGGMLLNIDPSRQRDLAMLLLEAREYGVAAVSIFWGLWLMPLGALVYRSGFMPRLLGVFLIAGGISYVILSLTFFLLPALHPLARYGVTVFGLSEFAMIFWLLIAGAGRRIRPMLMTGLALIMGLVPIMYSAGAGADVMKRIAVPMLGGVGSALVLVLIVFPAIFSFRRGRDLP